MLFSVINISYVSLDMYFEHHIQKKEKLTRKSVKKINANAHLTTSKIFNYWTQFSSRMRRVHR